MDFILNNDQEMRWISEFDEERPHFCDSDPAVIIALLATMIRFADLRDLRKRDFWASLGIASPSAVMRKAMVLTATPRDGGAGGGGRFVAALEPDILGEWFVLSALAKGADLEFLHNEAWRLAPKAMAQFLVRLAQDFKEHSETRALIQRSPPNRESQTEFGWAATDITRAISLDEFKDPTSIIDALHVAVEADDLKAMMTLAGFLSQGMGINQDKSRAFSLYEEAARRKYPSAQSALAYYYKRGIACDQNNEKAFQLWREASDNDYAPAMNELAICFRNGIGTVRSYEEAYRWWSLAACKGDFAAMMNLSFCYKRGEGVDKNPAEAVRWHSKAAESGDVVALRLVASYYERGYGVEKNVEVAADLYRKATEVDGLTMADLREAAPVF
ncbi:MAG: tetratricopeptide repeat protein [Pseudomonadota bacterium]